MNNLTKKAVIIITAVSVIFLAIGYCVGRSSRVSDSFFGAPASQLKDDNKVFREAMKGLIESTEKEIAERAKSGNKGHKIDIKSVL